MLLIGENLIQGLRIEGQFTEYLPLCHRTTTQTLRLSPDNITMTLHRPFITCNLPSLLKLYKVKCEDIFPGCRVLNSNSPTWSLFSPLDTPEAKLLLLTLKTQTQARADTITQHLSHFLLGQLHKMLENIYYFVSYTRYLVDIVTSLWGCGE